MSCLISHSSAVDLNPKPFCTSYINMLPLLMNGLQLSAKDSKERNRI